MSRKEERIQEEIRKRVIAEEFRRKDATNISGPDADANRQALDEITSLSREEVDAIAEQVRGEGRRRTMLVSGIITIIAIALISGAGFYGFKQYRRYRSPSLVEDFSDNQAGWQTSDEFEYRRGFQNNAYIFENGKKDWCYWDQIPFTPSKPVRIKSVSQWKEGKYDEYGVMLFLKDDAYLAFLLRGDGAAGYAMKSGGKWITPLKWFAGRAVKGDGRVQNTQQVDISASGFRYFINGRLFKEGPVNLSDIREIGLRVCDRQSVAFDRLSITDLQDEHAILLNETFDNKRSDPIKSGWTPAEKIIKRQYFDKGRYIIESNRASYCYWATQPITIKGDYHITLDSQWLKGETAFYGLMLMQNDDNYFGFEMENDGTARFVWNAAGKYKKIGTSKETSDTGKQKRQTIKIRKGRFEYAVNGRSIDKWGLQDVPIRYIGLRVCGQQSVAFDHLKVIPK